MTAFVMISSDSGKAGGSVFTSGSFHGLTARIVRFESGSDALEHPGAAEIEAIEMSEFSIASIRGDGGEEPSGRSIRGNLWKERR
jgi:hypothetical protein